MGVYPMNRPLRAFTKAKSLQHQKKIPGDCPDYLYFIYTLNLQCIAHYPIIVVLRIGCICPGLCNLSQAS